MCAMCVLHAGGSAGPRMQMGEREGGGLEMGIEWAMLSAEAALLT